MTDDKPTVEKMAAEAISAIAELNWITFGDTMNSKQAKAADLLLPLIRAVVREELEKK